MSEERNGRKERYRTKDGRRIKWKEGWEKDRMELQTGLERKERSKMEEKQGGREKKWEKG